MQLRDQTFEDIGMASFASQIAGHVQRAVFKAKANSCRSAVATATALSSRKAVPGVRVLPRPQAVGIHAAAAVVLAASAEDTVELQIKVRKGQLQFE